MRFKYIFRRRNSDERGNAEKAEGGVKSPEEVLTIAKEYGKELTLEQAKEIFDRVKAVATGELPDDLLEGVAGGNLQWIRETREFMGSLFGK